MDWKTKYVRRIKGITFDLDNISSLIQTIVDELNEVLINENQEIVSVNEYTVTFPDCIISYKLNENKLQFLKSHKNNPSSIIQTVNVTAVDEMYSPNNKDKKYVEFGKEAIEDIISQMLLKTR